MKGSSRWRRAISAAAVGIVVAGCGGGDTSGGTNTGADSGPRAGGGTSGSGGVSTGSGPGSGVVSCTVSEGPSDGGASTSFGVCEEGPASARSQFQQSCGGGGGTFPSDAGINAGIVFADGPCSHEGASGGCSITSGGVTLTIWYYLGGSGSPVDIRMLCAGIGATYVAP